MVSCHLDVHVPLILVTALFHFWRNVLLLGNYS